MTISIVVPSKDRPSLLRDCLVSLLAQARSPLEIIVVDNGSGPATAALVRSEFPSVRCVGEARQGVHHARNRGLVEARGEVVAFTDDDCLAPPGWLAALEDCFRDPAVACAGGPTRPLWSAPPAHPLLRSRRILSCLGILDLGPERKRIDHVSEFLSGANIAIRKASIGSGFRGVQPFRDLGVCGDDYELSKRLAREHTAIYEPKAYVSHRILARKLGLPHLMKRLFYFAASGARLGSRLAPRRRPAELLGWEGAVSAADALGHLYGRVMSSQ
ncbi:MAG: glycosyltransferase [Elusimicrobia bacterium]|nr:glycosyltransferase [Elusimicrobiota bacterium]